MSEQIDNNQSQQSELSNDAVSDTIGKLKGKDKVGNVGQLIATAGGGLARVPLWQAQPPERQGRLRFLAHRL